MAIPLITLKRSKCSTVVSSCMAAGISSPITKESAAMKYESTGPRGSGKFGYAIVQSAGDLLVRFFAAAFALQLARIQRLTENHTNRLRPWEKLSRWQGFARAMNENGNDGCRKMFEQHPDARLELLQFAPGRESALGKPNKILLALQDSGAKGQTRTRSAHGLDRQDFSQPAEKTHHRVREDNSGPTGPVSFAQLVPVEQCGNRERIEITDMVRREHPLSILRQMFQPFGANAKEQAHQHSIHGIEKTRRRGGDQAERLEPAFLFLGEGFVRLCQRIDRFAFAALGHFAQ